MAGYGDDAGFATWLADNGLSLPVGSPAPAVLRNRGSAYVDATYGQRLTCSYRSNGPTQERAWPRAGHPNVPSDVTPLAWVQASYRAGYLIATSGSLSQSISGEGRVQREKVDVIEQSFFDNGPLKPGEAVGTIDTEIDGMVSPFLCSLKSVLGIRAIGT
jgi:hypothetical protein